MNIADMHEAQLLAKGSGGAVFAIGVLVAALQVTSGAEAVVAPITFNELTSSTSVPSSELVALSTQGAMKAQRIRALFQRWTAEDSGHDESAWADLVEGIEQHRLSDRRRFG